ncbi:hypothetical protein D9V29_10915 [Mycetocola manganoxydans]|uniref:Uncharacterized protein n=1 Tax=Mycetocola manganoxydans TaxID=699879 RepID=A0A3L6ZRL5_9MICO|nr:hypothetical protein [Mycetocola manganoxydans]RLP69732.1 hypothetical protein D9V29_10915 [Mycetocola manganoxydans]GHD49819.1 hypothetical protein GCM10008097_22930 [Mycetocola manganoxydans]
MSPITGALPITLYWIAVLVLAAGCLAVIGVAHWQRKNKIIAIAAALLAVDLVLVALPSPESPLGVTIALGILSISIAVLGGGIATTYVLKLATRGLVRPGLFGGIIVTEPSRTAGGALRANAGEQHEVLRGGRTIGYLERFAVAATLMAGFAEAIAVIIAIKGVGRFTELEAAEARERFIIGTFASLIWAASSAALFHFALN